eukprot:COSAG01_NODE_3947_length_5505_cov_202.651128_6_plen_368_part_00
MLRRHIGTAPTSALTRTHSSGLGSLQAMGFSLERAMAALEATEGGVEVAVDWLLEHPEQEQAHREGGEEGDGPQLPAEGVPPVVGSESQPRRRWRPRWRTDAHAKPPEPEPESVLCAICYSAVDGGGGGGGGGVSELGGAAPLPPACGHLFHAGCWAQWFASRIGDGQVVGIRCPSCPRQVSAAEVQRVVSPELWARFQRFAALAALNADPMVRWCPKPGCATPMRGWERWPPPPPPPDATRHYRALCAAALGGALIGAVLTAVHAAAAAEGAGHEASAGGVGGGGGGRGWGGAWLEGVCGGRAVGGALAAVGGWAATITLARPAPTEAPAATATDGDDGGRDEAVAVQVAVPPPEHDDHDQELWID